MARTVSLFTGPWSDVPLEDVVSKASEWGYSALELCCWGDHFEIPRALSEDGYCQEKLDLLARYDLTVAVLGVHRVSGAVCDPVDDRHRMILPEHVWGDGAPENVRQRGAEEIMASARAAEKLGVTVLSGLTGSSLWSYVVGYPTPSPATITHGFRDFAQRWNPILDVCRDCGVKYAFEVHPGQIAFDLYTAEMALDALGGREEFGFTLDPSHLHWQGIDPTEFVRRFPDRIYHVHIKDVVLALNGRNGILGSCLPYGDPRRGWDFRSPGRGGIDWESFIRALNQIGYGGVLSVDWKDSGMERDFGAEEASKFVKRLDFGSAQSDSRF